MKARISSSRRATSASVGVWTRPSETAPSNAPRSRIDGGAGGVHAHEPVGLGARAGRGLERRHLLAGAQPLERVGDRLLGHRVEPEALDRLVVFEVSYM